MAKLYGGLWALSNFDTKKNNYFELDNFELDNFELDNFELDNFELDNF